MKQMTTVLLTVVLLLMTAHRLPAPIQEVPESPTPGATPAPKESAKTKPRPFTRPKTKSEPTNPPSRPSPPAKQGPYAGTWKGVITWGMWGDFEHTILIDDQQTMMTVKSISTAHGGTGIAGASIASLGITAQLPGLNGKWTLQPFPDGKTAKVRVTGVFLDSSAIFRRLQ